MDAPIGPIHVRPQADKSGHQSEKERHHQGLGLHRGGPGAAAELRQCDSQLGHSRQDGAYLVQGVGRRQRWERLSAAVAFLAWLRSGASRGAHRHSRRRRCQGHRVRQAPGGRCRRPHGLPATLHACLRHHPLLQASGRVTHGACPKENGGQNAGMNLLRLERAFADRLEATGRIILDLLPSVVGGASCRRAALWEVVGILARSPVNSGSPMKNGSCGRKAVRP